MKRLAPIFVACVLLALPASAGAKTITQVSEAGGVRATLTYNQGLSGDFSNFRLSITRGGVAVVSNQKVVQGTELGIGPGRPEGKSVLVVDLNGDGENEVIVDLFTGGAHCCFFSLIYTYSAGTAGYVSLRHNWGDAGYRLRDLDGNKVLEFLSGDFNFAYAFTSFAESSFPVQIWQLVAGRITDVTRRFPAQIRADARRLIRRVPRFRKQHLDVRGVLAAYQAENYLLGRKQAARGWRKLRAMARRGQIRRPRGGPPPRSAAKYLKALRKFLRRLGYIH